MTYIQAALTILAYAPRPLTVPELTAVALAEGLIHPRGRTPDRTMSSVLYRRMASDPDAPVLCRNGRFWLRGRPLPEEGAFSLAWPPRRFRPTVRRPSASAAGSVPAAHHPVSVLPPPPLRLPGGTSALETTKSSLGRDRFAPVRRERAIERVAGRGRRALARLSARSADTAAWDAVTTYAKAIKPLLAALGYQEKRGDVVPDVQGGRGIASYTLCGDGIGRVVLHVRRGQHDLDEDDAWRAVGQARAAGLPYAAVANAREVILYATDVADAQDDVASARVLRLDLVPLPEESPEHDEQTMALWLLSRQAASAGALDAYTANLFIGRVLLAAFESPDTPLARVVLSEVRGQTGLHLPPALVLRHARLALLSRRGRGGEPLPSDIAAVGAVTGPRRLATPVPIAGVAS